MSKVKVVRNILIVISLFVIIGVSIMTVMGEGVTFQSIVANIKAEQAFREISRGEYDKATDYIGFWGILQEGVIADETKIGEEKAIFVSELEAFFLEPSRELESYRLFDFRTDDGYTTGYTNLMIKDDGILYSVTIVLSYTQNKLCPMKIDSIETEVTESIDTNVMPHELMKILKTHYSG